MAGGGRGGFQAGRVDLRALRALALGTALLGGCGDNAGAAPADAAPFYPDTLYPLGVGTTWVYHGIDYHLDELDLVVVDQFTEVRSITAYGDVGGEWAGVNAYRIESVSTGPASRLLWDGRDGERTVRYAELDPGVGLLHYAPAKLRVDERAAHLAEGATWQESYAYTEMRGTTEILVEKTDRWTVVATSETISVPAGTFDCVVIDKVAVNPSGENDNTFWYARGVGKVQEVKWMNGIDPRTELQKVVLVAFSAPWEE